MVTSSSNFSFKIYLPFHSFCFPKSTRYSISMFSQIQRYAYDVPLSFSKSSSRFSKSITSLAMSRRVVALFISIILLLKRSTARFLLKIYFHANLLSVLPSQQYWGGLPDLRVLNVNSCCSLTGPTAHSGTVPRLSRPSSFGSNHPFPSTVPHSPVLARNFLPQSHPGGPRQSP